MTAGPCPCCAGRDQGDALDLCPPCAYTSACGLSPSCTHSGLVVTWGARRNGKATRRRLRVPGHWRKR